MLGDEQLLRQYAAESSDAAFGELVGRYVNLVYSAALRRAGGDTHLAHDAAQLVFTALARKAGSLPKNVVLAGWLHRATGYTVAQLLRTERRRQAREQEAVAMNSLQSEPAPDWDQIRPLLDEALDRLAPADRDALLLRFFDQRSLAGVGEELGTNEDTARKRVSRALDRLRAHLIRRGITTPVAAFATVISAHAVQTAPAGLAATLTTASLASAATGTATAVTLAQLMAMTKLKVRLLSVLVVGGVATPLVIQHQAQVKLRAENEALRQRIEQLVPLADEGRRGSTQAAQAEVSPRAPDGQLAELLRLRGEVARLRGAAQPVTQSEPVPAASSAALDTARQLALAVAQGDPTARDKLGELARTAFQYFKTNSTGLTDQQKDELQRRVFGPMWSAFDVLTEEAAKGNQTALQAMAQSFSKPSLKGFAIRGFGVLAGSGNESALNILLDAPKYNIPIASAVGALQPAASNGNQRAIDALAAVIADDKQGPLWTMAAYGLKNAAASGNDAAVDALVALSSSTNSSDRRAVTEGLKAAATNQNAKAIEALRRMNAQ